MGLSERLLVGLSAESSPLPPQVQPQRVRGLRRSQIVELVRRIGGEEAERLQVRERELELRELAALEQLAELESELQVARERIVQLEESQSNTARYELPRLADMIVEEQSRAEALGAEVEALKIERDALAERVAELESGTAQASADADLEAAAAVFAEGAGETEERDLSETAEFFGDTESIEDAEVQALLAEAGLGEATPAAKAQALLGADPDSLDELGQAAQALLGAAASDSNLQEEASAEDEARGPASETGTRKLTGQGVQSPGDSEDLAEVAGGVRVSDLERALISSSSEAAAANRRAEELSERLALVEQERQELLEQVQRLRGNLAAQQSSSVAELRGNHHTQRLKAPLIGRPELPGIVTDASGEVDLDHLLGAYVKAEERAARIDILEEVVWRLEAGKPSSEAWRRALEQVRRACAHEQAAREEAARALNESETQRVELEARLRSSEDERSHGQLELQTLIARYAAIQEALERSREELEAGRLALAEAREEADSAGQAWSQAEDELGEVTPVASLGGEVGVDLEEEFLDLRQAYEALATVHDDLREAHRDTLDEIETLNAEQGELELELEHADLEVQRLELSLVSHGLPLAPEEGDPEEGEPEEDDRGGSASTPASVSSEERATLAFSEVIAAPQIVHPGAEEAVDSSAADTDLFDAPPLSEGLDSSGEADVVALQDALAEASDAADNYERARRAFHEAQAQRDEALQESARWRQHLAESRTAEAAWAWSASAAEAALEERLDAAESLRVRLGKARASADSSGEGEALDANALMEASRGLEDRVGAFVELNPEDAREALVQSEAALAELEAVLLKLGASDELPALGPVGAEHGGALAGDLSLEERLAQLELELAAARGRAGGAQDVAAGLRERLREHHEQNLSLSAELEGSRAQARELAEELSSTRGRRAMEETEPATAAALATAQAELAEARARLGRLEEGEHQAAAARDLLREEVREAKEARRSADEELQRALAERDLARSDTASSPDSEESGEREGSEDSSAFEDELHEVYRAELGGALGELELTQAELEETQSELEASEAELEMLRTELGLAQARVAAAEEKSARLALQPRSPEFLPEGSTPDTKAEPASRASSEGEGADSTQSAALEEALTESRAALEGARQQLEAEQRAGRAREEDLAAALNEAAALRARVEKLESQATAAAKEGARAELGLAGDLESSQERLAAAVAGLSTAALEGADLRERLSESEAARQAAERANAVAQAEFAAKIAAAEAGEAERGAAQAEALLQARLSATEEQVALQAELEATRTRLAELEAEEGRGQAERARLETVLGTHQSVQAGLEARVREGEARIRQAQAEAQGAQQEVTKLEAVLGAQRSVQEGLERRLQERERGAEGMLAAATQAGRVEGLELELASERGRREGLELQVAQREAELEGFRSQMSEAVAARATTEVELESLRSDLARAEAERDEAEASVARLLAQIAKEAADPVTDVLEHPDLPESAALAAARVGSEDSALDLERAREELSDLRLLLSEQEQLSMALRSELVELQAGQQSRGEEDHAEDAPVSDFEATLAALEEELTAKDTRAARLESERARLSDEVYDLGRLLESECWRGLATHRDLVRAHQRLRTLEEAGGSTSAPGPDGSADKVLAAARRSLVAEGPPGDEGDDEVRQEAVAWLLTQAPQRAEALAESSGLLPRIEEELRDESEALLHMRQEFRGRRQGLLEDLLTAERAVRNATEVGVQTGELDRRAKRATSRLGDFDAHLEIELRAREEARGMLEDLRLWLLWELGEHGVAKVGDSDPGEDRVEALELQQAVESLQRRLDEEERQRRQLERDAMQAMEELEEDRQRLERDLAHLVEAHLKDSAQDEVDLEQAVDRAASAEDRVVELEGALATQGGGNMSASDDEQLRRQAERIAALSWDLESRESLVHWLMQELDPRVRDERDGTKATCAQAVRESTPPEGVDSGELLHWLEAAGGQPANGNAEWIKG